MRRNHLCHLFGLIVLASVLSTPTWAQSFGIESYVGPYNVLAGMLNERLLAAGISNTVSLKDAASTNLVERSVSQLDLNVLRSNVVVLLSSKYVVASEQFVLTDPTPADAFPFLLADSASNIFTKVPGEYRSSGGALHANDFTNVPPLWVHLAELYDKMCLMTCTIASGQWTAKGEQNERYGEAEYQSEWATACDITEDDYDTGTETNDTSPCAFTEAEYYAPFPAGDFYASMTRRFAYYSLTGLHTGVAHHVNYFSFATAEPSESPDWEANGDDVAEAAWHVWSSTTADGLGSNTSSRLGSADLPRPYWCAAQDEFRTWSRGYMVTDARAILTWDFSIPPLIDPAQDDPETDGVAADECACTACTPGIGVGFRGLYTSAQGVCALGESVGLTNGGLRVRARISDYKVDGVPRQMFNLDTRAAVATNSAEGWGFVTVRRPSGTEVVFALQGGHAGKPVSLTRSYSIQPVGDGYELLFPNAAGYVVHRFAADGSLNQVRQARNHAEVSIDGSTNSWPGMSTYRDGDRIASNVCASIVYVPAYADGLATAVFYSAVGGEAGQGINELLPGSRIFRERNAAGAIVNETRIVATNGTEQIWSGVSGGTGAVTVARKDIRWAGLDASNDVLSVYEVAILDPDTANARSNRTLRLFASYPWGRERVSETVGYGSTAARTTVYTYYANAVQTNLCGRLALVETPDGGWTRYEYDPQGRETLVCQAFMAAQPTAATNACRTVRSVYPGDPVLSGVNFPASDVTVSNDTRPRLVIETVMGQEVGRTYHAYLPDRQITKRCSMPGAAYDDADSLVTVVHAFTNGPSIGRPWKIEREDGTLSLFGYGYDVDPLRLITTNMTGAGTGETVTNGTMTVSVSDANNRILSTVTTDIASGLAIAGMNYTRDAFGRSVSESNIVTGATVTRAYGCCGPESETDAEGVLTQTTYNDLKQVYAEERLGVTTYRTYDVNGAVLETRRSAPGLADIVTVASFDDAGRLASETNELGLATLFAYATNETGGIVHTTTSPDGGTRVETHYRDGQVASVGGTAAHPVCFCYGADTNGAYTIEYKGADTNATEWIKTYRNMLGQTWKTVYPDGYTRIVSFDAFGRQIRLGDGVSTMLTAYNDRGEPFRSAVDMDNNGQADLTGTDRIDETSIRYTTVAGKTVRETHAFVYPTNGSAVTLPASTALAASDGSAIWDIRFGRTNETQIVRSRASASRIETVIRPDGTRAVGAYTNGLLMSLVEQDALAVPIATRSFVYDAFQRLVETHEPAANGDLRVTVQAYNPAGAVTSVTVSAGALSQTTSYELDAMGRRVRTVLPDNGEVRYQYNLRGELTLQSGARTYPVAHSYTDQGRPATMSTYRNGTNGAPDVTSWLYDAARGWVTAKVYADGTTNAYAYFGNGKLQKRTWARGIETAYAYDTAGALTNVDYSDATPDVAYTLDRLGRPAQVVDGIGTWQNFYAPDGSLQSATLPQLTGGALAYGRDSLGRLTNVSLTVGGQTVHRTVYGFDDAGRLGAVGDGTTTATYGYGDDGATWTNLNFSGPLTVTRSFDGLDRLTEISNKPGAASPISFAYALNQANQRTTNSLGDGARWVYEYNERGEVVSGKKYFSDGTPVQGAQFEYEFDTIGNRVSSEERTATAASAYTANNLNQYSQRTVPGQIFVAGEAATGATVSVRLDTNTAAAAARHGGYFWKALAVDNTSAIVFSTNVQVTAHMSSGTNSLVRTETRSAVVPRTPETFSHDPDGNLTADGLWTNFWDAENRLVAVESGSAIPASERIRLTFRYDHQGRRTVKQTESGWTGSAYGQTNASLYVYDGWNLAAELAGTPAAPSAHTNCYVWGLDLSGTLQGAGGVGGLLAAVSDGTLYLVCSDGNGNVTDYMATTGVIVAHREYDPFGGTVALTGSSSNGFTFWFSTKPLDKHTGWYDYGYRCYAPNVGRWISRDPIEEEGGVNLHQFVSNQPTSVTDGFGLKALIYPDSDTDESIAGLSEVNSLFGWTQLNVVRTVEFYRAVKDSLKATRLSFAESDFAIKEGGATIGRLFKEPVRYSDEELKKKWQETYRRHRFELREADSVARWWADGVVKALLDFKDTLHPVFERGTVSYYHSHPPNNTRTATPSERDYSTLATMHAFNDSERYRWLHPYVGFVAQPVFASLETLANVHESELVVYEERMGSGRGTGIFIRWCD